MLVDAKDKFLRRMAATINVAMHKDSPVEMGARFENHTMADVKQAQAYAARARAEEKKTNR